jgi:hypothetical protein
MSSTGNKHMHGAGTGALDAYRCWRVGNEVNEDARDVGDTGPLLGDPGRLAKLPEASMAAVWAVGMHCKPATKSAGPRHHALHQPYTPLAPKRDRSPAQQMPRTSWQRSSAS